MDNSSILKAFNNHLVELLEDVKVLFPSDINIKTALKMVSMLKKANPKMIIKGWKSYVSDRYKNEISNGDFDFFLNKNYQNDVDDVEDAGQVLQTIQLIKDKFQQMNEQNRRKTIKYVQNLTKLCDLYFSN